MASGITLTLSWISNFVPLTPAWLQCLPLKLFNKIHVVWDHYIFHCERCLKFIQLSVQ